MTFKARTQCPECRERCEPGTSRCFCEELQRRKSYDDERAKRGLVPLYRPPSMR